VLEAKNVTVSAGETQIKVDSTAPSAREIQQDVYPFVGDVNLNNFQAFQGATQLTGTCFIAVTAEGAMNTQDIVNINNTLKMTGSLSAAVESTNKWGVLMVANSVFEG
jgi:hypothetical protein